MHLLDNFLELLGCNAAERRLPLGCEDLVDDTLAACIAAELLQFNFIVQVTRFVAL